MADFGMIEERFEPKRDIWKNREVSMKKNGKGAKDPNRLGFGTLLKYKSSDVAQAGIQATGFKQLGSFLRGFGLSFLL